MKGRIIQHVTRVTKIYLLALGTTQISSFFWKVECSTYTRKQVTGAMAYMPFVRKCWDRLRIHINTQILFTFPDRVSGIICAHVSRSPGAHASINRYSSTASAWSSYIKHPCAPYSSTTDRNWQTHHKRFAHKTDRKQTRPEVRGRTAKSRKWWLTLEPLVLPAAAAAAAWGKRHADRWQQLPKFAAAAAAVINYCSLSLPAGENAELITTKHFPRRTAAAAASGRQCLKEYIWHTSINNYSVQHTSINNYSVQQ